MSLEEQLASLESKNSYVFQGNARGYEYYYTVNPLRVYRYYKGKLREAKPWRSKKHKNEVYTILDRQLLSVENIFGTHFYGYHDVMSVSFVLHNRSADTMRLQPEDIVIVPKIRMREIYEPMKNEDTYDLPGFPGYYLVTNPNRLYNTNSGRTQVFGKTDKLYKIYDNFGKEHKLYAREILALAFYGPKEYRDQVAYLQSNVYPQDALDVHVQWLLREHVDQRYTETTLDALYDALDTYRIMNNLNADQRRSDITENQVVYGSIITTGRNGGFTKQDAVTHIHRLGYKISLRDFNRFYKEEMYSDESVS